MSQTESHPIPGGVSAALLEGALTLETLHKQRELVEKVMASVMKEGIHYGKLPGSREPSLLKPGAQLLCTLFRLRPEYQITETLLPREHKAFKVCCRLYLMGTEPPVPVSEGYAESTSMESKHRFRSTSNAGVIFTDDRIPPMYFNINRTEGREAADKWLGVAYDGKNVTARKNQAGQWVVAIVTNEAPAQEENANPADVWNTVLKMGCKRAFVDATITATASNDFFTQDLEDMAENLRAVRAKMEEEEETPGAGKTEAPAEPGKTKAKAKGKGKKGAEEDKEKPGSWRVTVCHIGKRNGPIYGRTLGSLDDGQRDWLLGVLQQKEEVRRGKQDKQLLAALLIWNTERETAKRSKGAGERSPGDAAAEGNAGVNLEVLAQNLDWANIEAGLFMNVAHREQWTAAETFDKITDDEAAAIVDNIETVTELCRAKTAGGAN